MLRTPTNASLGATQPCRPTHALRTYLAARLPHYLAALRRTVEVNSFTENSTGVDAVGDLTAELFAGLGFTAERVPSADATAQPHATRWPSHFVTPR